MKRGGDRQLNEAIYTIAIIRINRDPATRDYVAKVIRSLKGYITRQIYRALNSAKAAAQIHVA